MIYDVSLADILLYRFKNMIKEMQRSTDLPLHQTESQWHEFGQCCRHHKLLTHRLLSMSRHKICNKDNIKVPGAARGPETGGFSRFAAAIRVEGLIGGCETNISFLVCYVFN